MLSVLLTACKTEKVTTINGIKLYGELKITGIEFKDNTESEYVVPGQKVIITTEVEYTDEEGKKASTVSKDVSIKIDSEAPIKLDGSEFIVDATAISGQKITITVSVEEKSKIFEYIVLKSPDKTIGADGIITDYGDIDAIVNKERSLPKDYVPSDLVKLTVPTVLANPEINQLRKVAADSLSALFETAKIQGVTLKARSGYRSYSTQNALYNGNVSTKGQEYASKYSAEAGKSEHQTGLAIDITSSSAGDELTVDFGETKEGLWVKENAYTYGFIIRYPEGKEDVVGYAYEPWHLRYVGYELAKEIFDSGLTVEEFFALK
ncbi:MAG: M15 family metallopeptidase [Eubacteriaceae bacterium]|nr:M15 family metallopeptidase [Eubacteriaceae bacterium]